MRSLMADGEIHHFLVFGRNQELSGDVSSHKPTNIHTNKKQENHPIQNHI
jgi:hypothetical protein